MPFNPLPPNNRPKKSRGSNCHTAALEAPCDMDFTLAPPAPISPCSQGALVPRPYPQVRKYVDRHSLSFNVPWSAFQARSRSRSVPVLIRMARHAIRRTTGQIHFLPANVSKVVLTVLMKSLPSRRSPSFFHRVTIHTTEPPRGKECEVVLNGTSSFQHTLSILTKNPRESNQSYSSRYGSPSSLHYGEFPTLANLGTRYPGESQRRISPAFRLSRGFAVNDAASIFGDVVADTPGALGWSHGVSWSSVRISLVVKVYLKIHVITHQEGIAIHSSMQ
ncbi:hypothetical protein F5141DRAFT_1062051 [Pisolithus sp. B1]|nr:hypothetical protein F5141DRAFT_1062051 [Pisolithus sp. B1]